MSAAPDGSAHRAEFWIDDDPGRPGSSRRVLVMFVSEAVPEAEDDNGEPTSGRARIADFHILRHSDGVFHLDVIPRVGPAALRLTRIIQPGGRAPTWVRSILPELLGLAGGEYDLIDARVEANAVPARPLVSR